MRDYEGFIGHLVKSHQFTEYGAEIEVGRHVLRYISNQGNTMLGSRWVKSELEKLYTEEGRTLEEIGEMFGVSKQRVHQVVRGYELHKPPRQHKPRKSLRLRKYNSLDEYFAHSSIRKKDTSAVLRRLLLEERGAKCEVCSTAQKRLHVHHYVYPASKREDVVVLCYACHFSKHGRNILDPLVKLELYTEYLKGVSALVLSRHYQISESSADRIVGGLNKVHHILFPDSIQAVRVRDGWGVE